MNVRQWTLVLGAALGLLSSVNTAYGYDTSTPAGILKEIRRYENSSSDTQENFKLVSQVQSSGLSWYQAGESFIQVLQATGARYSAEARQIYRHIKSINYLTGEDLIDLANASRSVVRNENSRGDAVTCIKAVLSTVRRGYGPRLSSGQTGLDLMASTLQSAGPTNTDEAIRAYRAVYQYVDSHTDLYSLKEAIGHNFWVENSSSDAAGNIELAVRASGFLGLSGSLETMVEFVQSLGARSTREAREAFRDAFRR